MRSPSCPGPRVGQLVEQVGEHVDPHEADAHHHRSAQHGVHVGVEQRGGDVLADAGPGEDRFGQDRPAEDLSRLKPGQRDYRQKGVAKDMPALDHPVFQSLGTGGLHILLANLVHEGILGQHGEGGKVAGDNGDGGEGNVPEIIAHLAQKAQFIEIIRGQPVSVNWVDGKSALFSNAKLAENGVEQILGGGFADHFSDGVDGDAQVHGDELEICRSAQGGEALLEANARAAQGVLMAGVDHHGQHVRADFTAPHGGADGVLESLNAASIQGTGFDDLMPGQLKLMRLINFVGDKNTFFAAEFIEVLSKQLDISDEDLADLVALAETEAQQATSLYEFTSLINAGYDYAHKLSLIENMWRIAYLDAKLDKYEEHLIRRISDLIYVSHKDFMRTKHSARSGAAD